MRSGDTRRIRVVLCLNCGLAYANPQLESDDIEKLYTTSYRNVAIDDAHIQFKEDQSQERIAWLMEYLPPTPFRALEIGCSEGILMRQLRDRGWNVCGVEPFQPYARYGIDRWRLDIRSGFFPNVRLPGDFELIAFIHVIEHIADPRKFLNDVTQRLAPGGFVFFETPNLWRPNYRRITANLFAAPHLAIFSPRSVELLLDACGLSMVHIDASDNLRVLAQRSDLAVRPRRDESASTPLKIDLRQLRVLALYRFLWIKEREYLSRQKAVGWLSSRAQRLLGKSLYDRMHSICFTSRGAPR
jgi:SAM-dependent methyltransferase